MFKNITFSAEEKLIHRARKKAALLNRPLNQIFREWLAHFVGAHQSGGEFTKLMADLTYVESGRKFSRDEMNER